MAAIIYLPQKVEEENIGHLQIFLVSLIFRILNFIISLVCTFKPSTIDHSEHSPA